MPSTKNKAKFYLPNRGKITQALIYFVRLLIRWPRSDGQSKKTWKQFRVNKRRKRQTKTQRKCRIPVQGTYIFELRPFFFNFIRLCTYKCCWNQAERHHKTVHQFNWPCQIGGRERGGGLGCQSRRPETLERRWLWLGRLKFSACLVIGFHILHFLIILVYKIGSVESSSAVRTGRQLDQRQATETECTSLSEACSTHVNTVDITLQSTWTEAFKNTAPHQLTSDIQEIQGISHLRVTL